MDDETREDTLDSSNLLRMTSDVVAAYFGNNTVAASQISEVINSVHASHASLLIIANRKLNRLKLFQPTVNYARLHHLLEDGKRLKMLKRHLRTTYNMTLKTIDRNAPCGLPDGRAKLCAQRSEFAKKIGLGRKAVKRR